MNYKSTATYMGYRYLVVGFNKQEELTCLRPIKASDTDLYDVWVRNENVDFNNIYQLCGNQ